MRSTGVYTTGQTVRVAELARIGGAVCAVRLTTLPLASTPGATPNLTDVAPSGHASALDSMRAPNAPCVASLPAPEVLTRVWTLPLTSPAKLRAMVTHRLEADLPIPLEQLAWDCRAARLSAGGSACVLAQAARRDRIGRHVESLRSINLLPSLVTTEAEALSALAAHGLSLGTPPERFALVFAGEHEWVLAVVYEQLVRAVRRATIDPAQPEAAARALRQVIAAESNEAPLAGIWWIGSSAAQSALQTLGEALNVPVHAATASIQDQTGAPIDPEKLSEFGPALGLALAGLHETDAIIRLGGVTSESTGGPHSRIERWLARPRRLAAAAAIGLILATAIEWGALHTETNRMRKQLVSAASMPANDDLDAKVQALQRLQAYRIDVEGILAEVAKALPNPVVITTVQLSRERRLVLKGTSGDAKAPYALAEALTKSAHFSHVTPERSAPGQGGEFTLTADIAGIQKLTGLSSKGAAWR